MLGKNVAIVIALSAVLAAGLVACSGGTDPAQGAQMTGGDPKAGEQAIVAHDCTSCHVIPGIAGETNVLGPSLAHWAKKSTVAKNWPNDAKNLENWIRHSEQLKPGTTMKMMSISEKDAKDIAAYLLSLN